MNLVVHVTWTKSENIRIHLRNEMNITENQEHLGNVSKSKRNFHFLNRVGKCFASTFSFSNDRRRP